MRLFFTSDLHVDAREGASQTHTMAEWLEAHATSSDVLILGGDYGHADEAIQESLAAFETFPGRVLALAGNHDIWGDPDTSSLMRHYMLWERFESFGYHPLGDEPLIVGDVGFVGSMGWYDYSFRDPTLDLPMEMYRDKRLPGTDEPVWRDAEFVQWPYTDPGITEHLLERLRGHLESLRGEVSEIVAAFHHVPTRKLLRPEMLPEGLPRRAMVPRRWLVLNTFLGSQEFSDLLADYADRIDLVLCGHIHLARRTVEHGMTFVSNGSDYDRKEVVVYDGSHLKREHFGDP